MEDISEEKYAYERTIYMLGLKGKEGNGIIRAKEIDLERKERK